MDVKNIFEKIQKNADKIIFLIIFSYALIWSAQKERLELGCNGSSVFQLEKQCNDDKSIYIDGTKPSPDDSVEKLYERLESTLSYHEKAGIWRRCFLLASACVLVVIALLRFDCLYKDSIYFGAVLLILFFAIIYFFFNFLNFHHMRRLKNNGMESLELLKKKCQL